MLPTVWSQVTHLSFSDPFFGRHPGLTGVTPWWYPLKAKKVHHIQPKVLRLNIFFWATVSFFVVEDIVQ